MQEALAHLPAACMQPFNLQVVSITHTIRFRSSVAITRPFAGHELVMLNRLDSTWFMFHKLPIAREGRAFRLEHHRWQCRAFPACKVGAPRKHVPCRTAAGVGDVSILWLLI